MTRRTRLSVETLDDRYLPSFSRYVGSPVAEFEQTAGVGFTHGYNYTSPYVTADFNNDGRGDVFEVKFEGMADWAVGTVYLDRGDGTFDEGWSFPVGSNPGWVAAGDIY